MGGERGKLDIFLELPTANNQGRDQKVQIY